MHHPWTRAASCALVVTLVLPAHALAAGPADRDDKVRTPAAAAPAVSVPDSILLRTTVAARSTPVSDIDWGAEIATAVTAARAAVKPAPRSAAAPRTPRAQYGGGGGKGAMISMILTTVVTLGATVYMLKYLRDQQNSDEGGGN